MDAQGLVQSSYKNTKLGCFIGTFLVHSLADKLHIYKLSIDYWSLPAQAVDVRLNTLKYTANN